MKLNLNMKTGTFFAMLLIGALLFGASLNTADAETAINSNSAANSTVSNQPAAQSVDVEAKEIGRLMALALDKSGRVTNGAALEQATALKVARRNRYLDELSKSKDPVAVAQKVLVDPVVFDPRWAIGILEEHWQDSRSEQALEDFSLRGPIRFHDLTTESGIANGALHRVRAKKLHQEIISGKESETERTKAIVEYLENHPELTKIYDGHDFDIRRLLYTELGKSDDTNAIRLVLKAGEITTAFAKKHFKEMLDYAQGLTPEEAFKNPPLLDWLSRAHSPEVIPLFEKLLPNAKTSDQRSFLETALRIARNPRLADED
jgi:hypothetical protein